jgi:hypothetical protein
MPESPKADLHRCLQAARDALLWKLDGLSAHDEPLPWFEPGAERGLDRLAHRAFDSHGAA